MHLRTSAPRAVLAALPLALAACHDAAPLLPASPQPALPLAVEALACRADVVAGKVVCQTPDAAGGPARDLIVGRQNVYVTVASSNVRTIAPDTLAFDVTVKNLIPQAMGTEDGVTADPSGVRVFFSSGPVTTSGTGATEVANADGLDTFLQSNQPYFQYAGLLKTGQASEAKTWKLRFDPGVLTFEFLLYVSSRVQYPNGWVDVTPDTARLRAGGTRQLAARVFTAVGEDVTADRTITWGAPVDSAVAAVSAAGLVSGAGAGTTSFAVSSSGPEAPAAVTVEVSPANVLFVRAGATGANNGSSWRDAYTSLRTALAAAVSGQELWVAEGTYKPSPWNAQDPLNFLVRRETFALKDGVALYGGFAGGETLREQRDWVAHPTILSGDLIGNDAAGLPANDASRSDNSKYVLTAIGVGASTVLDGFTITGGNSNDFDAIDSRKGPGIFIQNGAGPTLRNLVLTRNVSFGGGTIFINNSGPTLTNVTISQGVSTTVGAGIYVLGGGGRPVLTNVTIRDCEAQNGAGLYNEVGIIQLTGVTFSNNHASFAGGGMTNYAGTITLDGVTFENNSAVNNGGGLDDEFGTVTASRVVFRGNSAGRDGGGIYVDEDAFLTLATGLFTGNTAGFRGGGVAMALNGGRTTLVNITVTGNAAQIGGGGIGNQSGTPFIRNAVVWGNTGGDVYNLNTSNLATISRSLIGGGCAGLGAACDAATVLNADPLFVDRAGGDLRLGAGSPAIDAGDNAYVPADATLDLAGAARIVDGNGDGTATVDLGAYERP